MDPLVAGSLALQAGTGVLKIGKSLVQGIKANNMLKNLERPEYEIQQGIKDNQAIAESRAQQGMSDQARRIGEQTIERSGMSALDAVTKGGGNLNNIGDLFAGISEGANRLAMVDEEMRVRNVSALMAQNERMAAEQEKAWTINQYAPYADAVQAAAGLKGDAAQNFSGGINSIGQAAANMASAAMYDKEQKALFNTDPYVPYIAPATVNAPARNAPAVGQIAIDPAAQAVRSEFPGLTTGGLSWR